MLFVKNIRLVHKYDPFPLACTFRFLWCSESTVNSVKIKIISCFVRMTTLLFMIFSLWEISPIDFGMPLKENRTNLCTILIHYALYSKTWEIRNTSNRGKMSFYAAFRLKKNFCCCDHDIFHFRQDFIIDCFIFTRFTVCFLILRKLFDFCYIKTNFSNSNALNSLGISWAS